MRNPLKQTKDLLVIKRYIPLLIPFLLLIGCNPQNRSPALPQPTTTKSAVDLRETDSAFITEDIEKSAKSGLPPEPIEVSFLAKDGQQLNGKFYPANQFGAPVIVLMHWYPGDQSEWTEIAYWLQNRGLKGDTDGVPWKDPAWFPILDPTSSYNVFTFTFRGCQGGCQEVDLSGWLLDAEAALQFARTLEGVDSEQVISIGASIGGDGAIDACAAVLERDEKACLGALSLSPGNYLGIPYQEMVEVLDTANPPRSAWCLYDKNDPDAIYCEDAAGENYYKESWSGGNLHGMHLITPNLDPQPLERIPEFLDLVLK